MLRIVIISQETCERLSINSSMFGFLVQCQLTDLVQDIVVSQFDLNALIKAYIVGVSV